DGTSVLRDVGVLHQPDAGADRTLGQQQGRQVREEGLRAAEVAGREGGAAAPRQDRRQADRTAQGPGRLYRRQAGRPVQGGSLPLLIAIASAPTRPRSDAGPLFLRRRYRAERFGAFPFRLNRSETLDSLF